MFYYMSPALCIGAAKNGVLNGSLIFFIILFLASLFLGRAYCGWVCPGGAIGDIYSMVNNKPAKHRWIKYIFWIPWFTVITILFIKSGGIKDIRILFNMESPLSIVNKGGILKYFILVILMSLLSLLAGKRSFCHHVCWMAPFMIIGERISILFHIPALHIKSNPENCTDCGLCSKICPMGIDVPKAFATGTINSIECINCGECIDVCKKEVMQFSFKNVKSKIL